MIVLCAVSPSYILLLRPTFGWLLCSPLQWQPSKPKAPSFSLFLFFGRPIGPPKQRVNIPPLCYSPACSLPYLSPFAATNLWLVVVSTHQVVAKPKGKALPISLFFNWCHFGTPNKGTSRSKRKLGHSVPAVDSWGSMAPCFWAMEDDSMEIWGKPAGGYGGGAAHLHFL
jgi:hypothetical protein